MRTETTIVTIYQALTPWQETQLETFLKQLSHKILPSGKVQEDDTEFEIDQRDVLTCDSCGRERPEHALHNVDNAAGEAQDICTGCHDPSTGRWVR